MDQEPRDAGQELEDQERTPEQVREEIEETRAELGDTVAALAHKTDVKAQAKQAVQDTKATVSGRIDELKADVGAKKDEFTSTVQDSTPESVGDAGSQLAAFARRHQTELIVIAALALGVLVGRRSGR
jgi:gas vesicle protein